MYVAIHIVLLVLADKNAELIHPRLSLETAFLAVKVALSAVRSRVSLQLHIPVHRGHDFHENVNADSSGTYSRAQAHRSHC